MLEAWGSGAGQDQRFHFDSCGIKHDGKTMKFTFASLSK